MNRRPELDWLRVVAIIVLHFFHVGMMFNTWDWHLKNPELLPALQAPMEVLHRLRMPMLMVISGIATAFAVGRRGVLAFAWDRLKRLLLPLAFGMLVIVPPQIYFERVQKGTVAASYLEFWPTVLDHVPYPRGSLSWHHLWFVAYLFIYCIAALPLLGWLSTASGRRALQALERVWTRGWPVAALGLVLLCERLLLGDWPETHALFDDPDTLAFYGLLFGFGHVLGQSDAFWAHVVACRWRYLSAAALPLVFHWGWSLMTWFFLLAALGHARAWFDAHPKDRPWLARAQSLAYPFYIWHQTVIVGVGFFWLKVPLGPWTRMSAVLVSSFVITWLLCEAVSRVTPLRPLFGLASGPAARSGGAALPRASPVA
jgi:hypothetical protein